MARIAFMSSNTRRRLPAANAETSRLIKTISIPAKGQCLGICNSNRKCEVVDITKIQTAIGEGEGEGVMSSDRYPVFGSLLYDLSPEQPGRGVVMVSER